jgi:hypothetical protein
MTQPTTGEMAVISAGRLTSKCAEDVCPFVELFEFMLFFVMHGKAGSSRRTLKVAFEPVTKLPDPILDPSAPPYK